MNQSEAPPTDNELLLNIRQKHRADIHKSQLNKRLSAADRQRCGLTEISASILEHELLTEKDVQGLSSRIKRRKSATSTDLKRLSAAFLHDPKNIETFSKITGALNIIVKELSGTEMEHQVLAAECLCNLALGDDVCSRKVAQVAGSYLVLYLDRNKRLIETCLWVIQNLLLSGEKTRKILIAQGLPDKLTTLLHGTKDVEVAGAAEETFAILVVEAWNDLPDGFSSKALSLLVNHHASASFYALYTILMDLNFNVEPEILKSAVKLSAETLVTATNATNLETFDFSRFLMSIRIITNALSGTEGHEMATQLRDPSWNLTHIVNFLISVNNEQISRETLWMLNAFYKVSGESLILDQNLKIPVKYL